MNLDWMDKAACKGYDTNLFFPGPGHDTKPARKVCMGCEVVTDCFDYAVKHKIGHGIWGARSERARRPRG